MDKKDDLTSGNNQSVHVVRPSNPEPLVVDDVTKLKHERSVQAFPELNLSDSEYVITSIKRHPIGLIAPFIVAVFLVTLTFIAMFNYDYLAGMIQSNADNIAPSMIILPAILFIVLVILIAYAAYYIYTNNELYLTNESVIQEIQTGLFGHSEQTISLMDIEDVSFSQDGLIMQLLNYGPIKLCTEGEGTTFVFTYVAQPKEHIAVINNAVEAFKNGRPVEDLI